MNLREIHIETLVIISASIFTIISLIISFYFPNLQILILTILTIILPATYQIGYNFSKDIIRKKNNKDFSNLEEDIEYLGYENEVLRNILQENNIEVEYGDENN